VEIYYVDGKFVSSDQAVIPVNDLAILRGYGIFDFLRTYNGRPLFLEEHIERLERSAKQIGLDLLWSKPQLIDIVNQTLNKNNHRESNIRIVVTGGTSSDYITPQGKPRLLVLVTDLPEQPQWWYTDGVKVITIYSKRNIPGAKSIDCLRGPRRICFRRHHQQSVHLSWRHADHSRKCNSQRDHAPSGFEAHGGNL
jgi:branched-chain amino acid aminotransferase